MSRTLRISLSVAFIVAALVVLYFISPADTAWMPKCWFKLLTGYDCPACGAQRAVHALLHGEFTRAIAYNPFMLLSVPYAALAVIASAANLPRLKDIVYHPYTLIAYIILFFAWWIVRNL